MFDISIHPWAVITAAIAQMVLGSIWYGPLFGKLWRHLSGITEEETQKAKARGMAKAYAVATVGALITAYVLAHAAQYVNAVSIGDAIELGFWIWLGFVAPMMLGIVLWEGKPVKLYAVNAGYQLFALIISSLVLILWV